MDSFFTESKIFTALTSTQNTRDSIAVTAVSSGIMQYQKGNYKAAASSFKQAISLKPDYVDAYNYQAMADLKAGNKKSAINAYNISLKLDRTQDDVHVKLANIYIEDKNYIQAAKELKAASKLNPSNPLPHYTLGLMQQQTDKPAEAVASFKQVVRLAPKDGNAYYGLGAALSAQGKYDEAIVQLKKATNLKRDFAPAIFELGNAYAKQGNTAKAKEQIDVLTKLQTTQADGFVADLKTIMAQPKISFVIKDQSTFNFDMGTVPLVALDTSLVKPGSKKEFTVTFQFDSDMDTNSVTSITNWKISKAGGSSAGLYDNGLYRSTDRAVATTMPDRIMYNPTNQQATVVFSIFQNASGTGTIDPSHLTFQFQGKDTSGKIVDPNADQYNGWADKTF
jgi:tetratricopeptide (TPR) repeat protein